MMLIAYLLVVSNTVSLLVNDSTLAIKPLTSARNTRAYWGHIISRHEALSSQTGFLSAIYARRPGLRYHNPCRAAPIIRGRN